MKKHAKYMSEVTCSKTKAIPLLKEIILKMENVFTDSKGYYFFIGSENIETLYNHNLLYDYKEQIKLIFHKNKNWDNIFNSENLSCVLLKWCFCIILGVHPYPYTNFIVPKYNFCIKKYYVPKIIL